MNRTSDFAPPRLALVVLAVAALTLGACGRKGGLDLPPSASSASGAGEGAQTEPVSKETAAAHNPLFNSGNPSDKMSYAPKGPKKSIILDPILD